MDVYEAVEKRRTSRIFKQGSITKGRFTVMSRSRTRFALAAVLISTLALIGNGWAGAKQAYPNRPIQLVVPFAPGAVTDVFGRLTAEQLAKKWGVPVNVVTKPGGNAVPGTNSVMQAAKDGYTLLVDGAGTSSTQALIPDLPYKVEDRTFIVLVSASPHAFMVRADAPWRTLKDMAEAIKKNPATFRWVSLGGASTVDITTRQFLAAIGVDPAKTSPVSFPGAAPGANAVAGGHVDIVVTNPLLLLPLEQAGKGRILAVNSPQRMRALPNTPTLAELGWPSVNYQFWAGLSGPPGLPEAVVDTWVSEVSTLVKDPAFVAMLDQKLGQYIIYAGPKDFKKFVVGEIQMLRHLYGDAK
jgi:tripartite-type tricarboxylate transporter receptor subunit TctC